jgi:hypothetical protein
MGATSVAGVNHLQMTYVWSCGKEQGTVLGVRITLDSQGLPVIWEVLDDRAGPRVIFVSQSLEEKAKKAFGPHSAGRHLAIEQPPGVAPDVVVARVIEDGPVAMGPIVHVTAKPCDISTVICRCMPTQARQLVGTKYYELKPLSDVIANRFQVLGADRDLAGALRIPPGF